MRRALNGGTIAQDRHLYFCEIQNVQHRVSFADFASCNFCNITTLEIAAFYRPLEIQWFESLERALPAVTTLRLDAMSWIPNCLAVLVFCFPKLKHLTLKDPSTRSTAYWNPDDLQAFMDARKHDVRLVTLELLSSKTDVPDLIRVLKFVVQETHLTKSLKSTIVDFTGGLRDRAFTTSFSGVPSAIDVLRATAATLEYLEISLSHPMRSTEREPRTSSALSYRYVSAYSLSTSVPPLLLPVWEPFGDSGDECRTCSLL